MGAETRPKTATYRIGLSRWRSRRRSSARDAGRAAMCVCVLYAGFWWFRLAVLAALEQCGMAWRSGLLSSRERGKKIDSISTAPSWRSSSERAHHQCAAATLPAQPVRENAAPFYATSTRPFASSRFASGARRALSNFGRCRGRSPDFAVAIAIAREPACYTPLPPPPPLLPPQHAHAADPAPSLHAARAAPWARHITRVSPSPGRLPS